MRNVPCRVCGRPVRGQSICGDCKQAASYASPRYRENSGLLRRSFRPGSSCVICQRPIADLSELSIEHKTPLRDGGTHDLDNLGYAHLRCNSAMKPQPEPKRYRRL